MVTFYSEYMYVLNFKPSQLLFESANSIKTSKEAPVMERKVLYISIFPIAFVLLHKYGRPDISRYLCMLLALAVVGFST